MRVRGSEVVFTLLHELPIRLGNAVTYEGQ